MKETGGLEVTAAALRPKETWGNHHPRMTSAERAKQFMPFAAICGVSTAMKEKEQILMAKPTLSEDQLSEINQTLTVLERGSPIAVYYFKKVLPNGMGEMRMLRGALQKLDAHQRLIRLLDTSIPLDDVMALEKL